MFGAELIIELLIGGLGYFGFKALDKAVIEPLATRAGREILERTVGPLTALLDKHLAINGIEQDFEGIIRDWLGHMEGELSDDQINQIIEEVFTRWDLRVAAKNCRCTRDGSWEC